MSDVRSTTWQREHLGAVACITVGGTPSTDEPEYWGGDVPWMASGDIHLYRVQDVAGRITKRGLKCSNAKLVPSGAVAIALAGQGKTRGTVALTEIELSTNQSVALISTDRQKLIPEFLFQSLIPRYEELRASSSGGGRGGLTKQILEKFEVFFPHPEEQRRIADLLQGADAHIEALEIEAEKEQVRAQGLLQQLFPDGFAVDGPPENCLGSALVGIEGGKSFMCSEVPASPGTWGVLKVSAIRPDRFVAAENKRVENLALVNPRYEVKEGDLLITRANTPELVGAACFVKSTPRGLLLCDKTLRLQPKKGALPQYLWLWLQTPVARRHVAAHATGTSAGMKNISQSSINKIPLTLPSPEEQERRVAPIVALLDYIAGLRNEAEKLKRRKTGLMYKLLTPPSAVGFE